VSLNKIIGLTLDEYKKFKPETVADKLALVLVKASFEEDGGVRAIQLIADRAGGRAVAKIKSETKSELAELVRKAFAGE
jgi:hypothetical protein